MGPADKHGHCLASGQQSHLNWNLIFFAELLALIQVYSPSDKRKNKHDGSSLATNLFLFQKSSHLSELNYKNLKNTD